MKTVLYHSADYDGIFCREIAKKFLKEEPDVQYIGWNFGDDPIPFPGKGEVYVMDLPPEKPFGRSLSIEEKNRVIWIDHHRSSIEEYDV